VQLDGVGGVDFVALMANNLYYLKLLVWHCVLRWHHNGICTIRCQVAQKELFSTNSIELRR